jgi:hypothetical protein
LTKGWNIFPILFWHTGFPLDVNAGLLARRTNPGPSGAGDSNLIFATQTGPIIYFNPHHATPGTTGNQYFEPNFTAPDPNIVTGSYGSGRNILRGPGRINLDMAFAKTTKITEHTAIELRTEFFNIFNHAEFTNPDTNLANPTFGQVTNTYDPRIIQFGARFTF